MSEYETAKKRAMYLIGGKDYSRKGLYEKLLENYSPETCEKVSRLMCEYGYIDDERYAEKLARHCIEGKRYGFRRAKQIMRQKGLGEEAVEKALSAYSDEELCEQLADLLERKYLGRMFVEGVDGRKERQKVVAALARRGYGFSEINKAMDIVGSRLSEDLEEE